MTSQAAITLHLVYKLKFRSLEHPQRTAPRGDTLISTECVVHPASSSDSASCLLETPLAERSCLALAMASSLLS